MVKRCGACDTVKPIDQFSRRSTAPDGRQARCRECGSAASKRWREQNAERAVENNRRWRAANPEAAKAATVSWREENRERFVASKRAWQARNRDHRLALSRADRAANPDRYRAALAEWKAANPERVREYQRKRRAATYGVPADSIDGEAAWEACDGTCGLCAKPIDRSLPWPDPESASLDHIFPLSKGGLHDQANVQWTHLICNLRKGARAS